ncbi:hypothetical protein CRE_22136 [Caenorhabditis remanei]|uniref:G-protein coupled receptors family 1 profile domain-containing protein n=1 Tax=Caenorhabditis remanei TaxID=31234 RepID=E3NIY8_CAERE|nr:hypothetical protein CRE_22136 [Caenorhabditis remanei]
MNQVIRYGSVQAIPIYNCSGHTPEEWTKRDGVSRPILGITEASLGILINICYIPILFVMLEKEHFKISCYKIMSFLAIADMLSIVVDCIITGWLSYQGAVFCSYPTLIYFSRMSGTGLWCCTCVTAFILITNRLFDLLVPRARIFFFEGNRTFLVIRAAILYSLYFVFGYPPCLLPLNFMPGFLIQ